MTKPAAVVLQLIGVIMALSGFGYMTDGSTVGGGILAAIGIALVVVGGRAVRRRIKAQ